jgi:hypothetical protein
MLNTMSVRSVLDVVTDFLAANPTPQEIIAYQLPDELLERNGEGQLTSSERQEMLDYMQVDQIMSLLKAKTHLKLKKASG